MPRTLFDGSSDMIVCYGDLFEARHIRALASPAPVATTVDREWRRLWLHGRPAAGRRPAHRSR
jgi:hypothetical protein